MKRTIRIITPLCFFVLWQASVQGATKYWDIDGATPGAGGDAPSGIWNAGTTVNWTTSSSGSSTGTTWADGDDAIFSAGTDATNAFTISLDNTVSPPVQTAGNLTVEEGALTISGDPGYYLNIGGGVAGKGIIHVATGLNLTISAELDSVYVTLGNDTGELTKTGTGTLTLTAANYIGNPIIVREGVLRANTDNLALGLNSGPTVVSNGAALHIAKGGHAMGDAVILNGTGITNSGAIRALGDGSWSGGATLASDASIHYDAPGTWNWTAMNIQSDTNSVNVTFGGNGGQTRLNIPGTAIAINSGVVSKEGISGLGLDQPSTCSAFYFNDGWILPRNEGALWGFGQGSIYVGAAADEFRTGENANPNISNPMVLAAGANPTFNCQYRVANPSLIYNITCNGVLSGLGGLSKTNVGTLFLMKHNTYAGNTTINWGFLTLGPSGSISNSTVINLQSTGSVFNVTSNAGGFVLQLAQTLKGNGTVLGNMNAKGTISPGASVGSLTNEGNLTLGGSLLIEVDKSLAPNSSNDMTTVSGTLSHSGGGALTVANLGPTLAVNDSFQVFNKAVTGGQTITVSGGGATWTNKLAVDGSIAVVSLETNVPATNLTIQAAGPTSVGLGGMGAANSAYSVYASTNVALPMSSWWKIGTTNSSGGGAIQFLDSQATNSQRFYRFGQP